MELKYLSLIFMLGAHFSFWLGSSAKVDVEGTLAYLKQKIADMEDGMMMEKNETAVLMRGVVDDLLAAVQENERKTLEAKRQIWTEIEEIENKTRNQLDDLSAKLEELRPWTIDQRDEVLKRVTEVEMGCEDSTKDVAGKLEKAEGRFTKIDNSLLVEILRLKTKSQEAEKRMDRDEQEFANAFEREMSRTYDLENKMNEIAFQLPSTEDILRNMSTLADHLRQKLNESLISRFENIQSNLTAKLRVFENAYSKFEKEYAKITYVSLLNDSLKSLEVSAKNELETLQSQLNPRFELLEAECALCNDVPEMKRTLVNHDSQLSRLNQMYLNFHESCYDEPPPLLSGKVLPFERFPGSIVPYECDKNFVMIENSTVNCTSGKWVGRPPVCRYFDASLTAVVLMWVGIKCSNDENYQKMQFSRVHENGLERDFKSTQHDDDLPTGARTFVDDKWASVSLYDLHVREKYGLYKCGFEENSKSAEAVAQFQKQYDYHFFDISTQVVNIKDTTELAVNTTGYFSKLRWKHNGEPLPSWDGHTTVIIRNVKLADAGLYECYHEDGHRALLRLIVRKCEKDKYGDNCDKNCPPCYNGGICHDALGICVCPPGFNGNSCEVACEENRFIANCSKRCFFNNCTLQLFCKPDPYGCTCAPGFEGFKCLKNCNAGKYGADCKQTCHCANGPQSCNIYTGACTGGCSPGWTGQSCQIKVDNSIEVTT